MTPAEAFVSLLSERHRSVAQLLAVVVSHTFGHAGEIAALKGIQGARGLPF